MATAWARNPLAYLEFLISLPFLFGHLISPVVFLRIPVSHDDKLLLSLIVQCEYDEPVCLSPAVSKDNWWTTQVHL